MNNNNQLAAPPRRSMRLATIIPASHWISIGYSNEEAEAMEKLQNDMKRYCDADRDQTYVKLGRDAGINDDMINIPNRYILPHWQRFAKGLNGRTSVEDIAISGITLPVSVLDTIFPTFQSINLSNLSLSNVGLGSDGLLRFSSSSKRIQAYGFFG